MLFGSERQLPEIDRCVGEWLERWAAEDPGRPFLAWREDGRDDWSVVSYGEARRRTLAVATWLLNHGVAPDRPVVILSGNSVRHAIIALAAMHIGVPVAPLSSGWSLLSENHSKVRAAVALLDPSVVFAEDLGRFAPAIADALDRRDVLVATAKDARGDVVTFDEMESEIDEAAVMERFRAVGHDTVAKLLFTSGSVGAPKAVITTQRMLTSNIAAKGELWPFLHDEPPVFLDWLPWSHTFAGNQTMNTVLRFGGTLYLDTGRPTPDLFANTLHNLRTVSPTIFSTVPRTYELLAPRLRADEGLRTSFFRNLRLMHYAGSTLSNPVFHEIRAIARGAAARNIPFVSSWGSTETAPMATDCHFEVQETGNIGVPIPGTVLKLVPAGDSLEVRVKGPNVTPGYWNAPETTAAAFDEEGFYRIGDAVAFVDADRPEAGLRFDGRISEDFKLSTGTWVRVGAMKARAIEAFSPLASDVVVAGAGRESAVLLVFPDATGCSLVAGLSAETPLDVVVRHPRVRQRIRDGMIQMSAATGSSMFPSRVLLLTEPPSSAAGEVTDKGYVNQRAVLAHRADLVELLLSNEPSDSVIALDHEERRAERTG